MKKFVAVMNVPAPYRQHLFNELWRQLQARGVDFHVHYMARGFKARPDSWMNPQIDFPHTYWRNWGTSEHQFNPGMLVHLLTHQPDWLMCGSSFYTPTGIGVTLGCMSSRRIAWVEGNAKTPGEMHGWRGWIKRWVLSRCQSVAVPGAQGVAYIQLHQNLTTRKMPTPVFLPNLVDENLFLPHQNGKDESVESTRRQIGCKENERLCFIPARFVWDKGLKEFFSILTADMVQGWKILILGHGPLQAEVEEIVSARGLKGNVVIKGSIPYEEVPIYYSAADLFLLPSVHDQNPLCVVEALHSGLPIALSCQAGNVEEAVTEGKNGWVLPVMNPVAFATKLREVFATPKERLSEMGRVSKAENARFWNSKEAIARFLEELNVRSE